MPHVHMLCADAQRLQRITELHQSARTRRHFIRSDGDSANPTIRELRSCAGPSARRGRRAQTQRRGGNGERRGEHRGGPGSEQASERPRLPCGPPRSLRSPLAHLLAAGLQRFRLRGRGHRHLRPPHRPVLPCSGRLAPLALPAARQQRQRALSRAHSRATRLRCPRHRMRWPQLLRMLAIRALLGPSSPCAPGFASTLSLPAPIASVHACRRSGYPSSLLIASRWRRYCDAAIFCFLDVASSCRIATNPLPREFIQRPMCVDLR